MPSFDTISIALRKTVSTRPLKGAMILPFVLPAAAPRPIAPLVKEVSPQSFSDMNCPLSTGAFNMTLRMKIFLRHLNRFLISCLMIFFPTSRTGFEVTSSAVFFAPRLLKAAFKSVPIKELKTDTSTTPFNSPACD